MCGIIGGTSKTPFDPSDIKILFLMAMERGEDSCGIANLDSREIVKEVGSAYSFVVNDMSDHSTWIGHTRAKTTGVVSNRNAHPFRYGDVTGVHNGVISNYYKLKGEENIDLEVDSEIIFHLIDKYGIKEALPKLSGSLALSWFEDDKLHLYRYSNPTSIAKYNGGYVFASLPKYLEAIGIPTVDIKSTKEHYLYTFKDGELLSSKELEARPQSSFTYNRGTTYGYGYSNGKKKPIGYNTSEWDDYYASTYGIPHGQLNHPTTEEEDKEDTEKPKHSAVIIDEDGITYRYWVSRVETSWLNVEMEFDGVQESKVYDLLKEEDVKQLSKDCAVVFEEIKELINEIKYEHS